MDDEERLRINVFDWEKEFPEIMKSGGFDAVIGNPPYIRIQALKEWAPTEVEFYKEKYIAANKGNYDIYVVFVENCRTIASKAFNEKPWHFGTDIENNLVEKIFRNSTRLTDLPARIGRGSSSGDDEVFILQKAGKKLTTRQGDSVDVEDDILRVPIYATDFGRYLFAPAGEEAIIFPYDVSVGGYELKSETELKKNFPKTYKYLAGRRKELEKRKQFKEWYSFSSPRNLDVHSTAQILVPLLADKAMYCRLPDKVEKYCLMASGGFSITVNTASGLFPNYVLGLLNSNLLFWRLRSISNKFRGGWITCTKQYVETLPIHNINISDPQDKDHHDKMVSFVDQMISLNKQLAFTKTDHKKTSLQRQIDATDKQIDKLIYELYGLTDEEIKIAETYRKSSNRNLL